MYKGQYLYYDDNKDTLPIQVIRTTPKMVYFEDVDGRTRRINKSKVYYQETQGGFIYDDVLIRLHKTNSKKIPDFYIIGDKVCEWVGIGSIELREATNDDFNIYPVVVIPKYIRWCDWTSEDEYERDLV